MSIYFFSHIDIFSTSRKIGPIDSGLSHFLTNAKFSDFAALCDGGATAVYSSKMSLSQSLNNFLTLNWDQMFQLYDYVYKAKFILENVVTFSIFKLVTLSS